MKPLCDLCGSRHESYQAHVFATNNVATNRIATNTSATNKEPARRVRISEEAMASGGVAATEAQGDGAVSKEAMAKTKNRRSRESYNAYQREYMRKKRALKSA